MDPKAKTPIEKLTELWNNVKTEFDARFNKQAAPAPVKTKAGKSITINGEKFEITTDVEVFEIDDAGVKTPASEGVHEMEDGSMFTIVAGKVTEFTAPVAVDPGPPADPAPADPAADPAQNPAPADPAAEPPAGETVDQKFEKQNVKIAALEKLVGDQNETIMAFEKMIGQVIDNSQKTVEIVTAFAEDAPEPQLDQFGLNSKMYKDAVDQRVDNIAATLKQLNEQKEN